VHGGNASPLVQDLLRKFGLKLRKPPSFKEMQNTIELSEYLSKYAKAGALLTTGKYAEDSDADGAVLLGEESEEDEVGPPESYEYFWV
jgi:hypothetical protein